MATGETGLKARVLEVVRSTKAQREPLLTGSQYSDTKKVIQHYEEQRKYLLDRLAEAEGELEACKGVSRQGMIVKEGFQVKGYGLLVPLRDDLDICAELDKAINSMQHAYGLGLYMEGAHEGKIVLYPYQVRELSLWFPEPLIYDLTAEMATWKRSFKAAYAVQVYAGAVKSVEQAIRWEENAATIVGNVELAERLKESDTTLLVSLAAAAQADEEKRTAAKLPAEPTLAEVEKTIQEMAAGDLEIRTPSAIAGGSPLDAKDQLTGIDVVNTKSPRKKIKSGERAKPRKKGSNA
ncbi:hypothetical protein [Methanomassiliicoccus luminyensis]|uniref:hypothetical protein n=1 Tax=Methanomassiliicoccus luminyensis TaxID=1080712 RepID=UPI000375E142|nr:hypothetical protein [Methanomassiliicoccus luminyensis]